MKTFLEYLQTNSSEGLVLEAFENLIGFDKDILKRKEKYVDDVWKILQDSYRKIGGIKGSGFNDEKDMMKKIWFWKLYKQQGRPVAVIMYKDREGRKMVALGTDGSDKAKGVIHHNNARFIDSITPEAVNMIALAEKLYREQRFIDVAYSTPLYLKDFQATTPKKKVL